MRRGKSPQSNNVSSVSSHARLSQSSSNSQSCLQKHPQKHYQAIKRSILKGPTWLLRTINPILRILKYNLERFSRRKCLHCGAGLMKWMKSGTQLHIIFTALDQADPHVFKVMHESVTRIHTVYRCVRLGKSQTRGLSSGFKSFWDASNKQT